MGSEKSALSPLDLRTVVRDYQLAVASADEDCAHLEALISMRLGPELVIVVCVASGWPPLPLHPGEEPFGHLEGFDT